MRILTEEEMIRLERWAKQTQIAKMLSFFDMLPRFFHVPRPLLLGCNNKDEILIQGDTTTSQVKGILSNLDEPFNPRLKSQSTKLGKKRENAGKSVSYFHQELQKGMAELCLLKGHGKCGQTIVRAHSIQKALFKGHAKNGHVYQFEPFNGTRDADKRLWPDLVGVNRATTFTGFCESHDSEIFSPIENVSFQNSPQQKFLYHYRAFAQSYYGMAHKFKIIENAVARIAVETRPESMKSLLETVRINQHDLLELKPIKSDLETQLLNKNWPAIEGYAFCGGKMADVLTTEFFAPRKDFQGKIIQDTKSTAPLNWISLTITASDDKAVILLCGKKGSLILRQLAASFRNVPLSLQTTVIIAYVMCHFENFIMLPHWWESLSKEAQLKFVNACEGKYFRRELPNTCDWELKEITIEN